MTNIKQQILDMVEKSGVKMIPRWQFVLYSSLGIIGLVFTFLSLIFVSSLILFLLSKYGYLYLPFFGFGAALHGVTAIPGLLLALGIVLVILVELLARHYSFSFKKPFFVTISAIVLGATLIGYAVSLTSFHEVVRDYARKGHMGGGMMHAYDRPLPFKKEKGMTVVRGVVIATTSTTFSVQAFDEEVTMLFASTTDDQFIFPMIGDDILVFGKVSDGKFEVLGVRARPSFERHLRGNDKRIDSTHRNDMTSGGMMK